MDEQAITQYLKKWCLGDESSLDRVIPLVYQELRALAARQFKGEPSGHTLQPTALVNEAYFKLRSMPNLELNDRGHFFAVASRLMRQVLVDHARRRGSKKRGGGALRVSLESFLTPSADPFKAGDVDMIHLDGALEDLAALDERQARIVEMIFFAGLTVSETAELLGISDRTVKREWRSARAWLNHRLSE